ncbi:MAG: hypothetical protein MMC23_009762 [Stictis urceolatum]|nr:hypothetical protein [Stictis urceolata]
MSSSPFHVAIIGAGLSGLALALALHRHSIPCTIYEFRSAPLNIGGALMLTPNGLKVLQKLSVLSAVQQQGFNFDTIYLQDAETKNIIETFTYGSEAMYGLRAVRIYRSTVLQILLSAVSSAGITIHYSRRFTSVNCETPSSVTFAFADGSEASASLLVGADGIHSSVRRYVVPQRETEPEFLSLAAIVGAVPTAQLELSALEREDLTSTQNQHPFPIGIVVPRLGAFVMAPQTPSGDEILITVTRRLAADDPLVSGEKRHASETKDALRQLLRQDSEQFPAVVRNAVREVPDEGLLAWPFYKVPELADWTSSEREGGHGRVLILGDAAHALPPAAGQGVNQAFEDIWTLAGVLAWSVQRQPESDEAFRTALGSWQRVRNERIRLVHVLNDQMNARRAPAKNDGEKTDPEQDKKIMREGFDQVLRIDIDEEVKECLSGSA